MNPVWQTAAEQLSGGAGLMGLATLLFLVVFLGWTLWAYAPGNRAAFEAAARLPLDSDEEEAT